MKNTLLIFLVFTPFLSIAQSSGYTFTEVVEVPGLTKDQIFIAARQWIVRSFNDAKEVIQLADKETGEIATTGLLPFKMQYPGFKKLYDTRCKFRISIWVKDGKYKYEFTDFTDIRAISADKPSGTLLYTRIDSEDEPNENNIPMQGKKRNTETYKNVKSAIASTIEDLIKDLEKTVKSSGKSDF